MTQQNCPRLDLAHKVQQIVAVRVRGEIKVLDFAASDLFTGAGAEKEWLAVLRNLQPPSWCTRICITNEKNGLMLIVHHPRREIMRGSIFTHHARRNHKDQSTA